jgi:hypothetical protein
LKKIILFFVLFILSLPTWAASKEVFFLSKLIGQNLDELNPKSLVNIVEKLNSEASRINTKDKKAFLNKAGQIYIKQKKITQALQKITKTNKNQKSINDLLTKIKGYKFRSRSTRNSESEIISRQIEINNQIQKIMSELEIDIESAKEALLTAPFKSGLFGISEEIKGDCMPKIGNAPTTCVHLSKKMTINIRKPVSIDNFDSSGALVIKTGLIKQYSSDENGFFEINLDPGIYSILVLDGDREVCNSGFSRDGLACTIEIENGTKTFHKLILDNAVW